MNAKGILPR